MSLLWMVAIGAFLVGGASAFHLDRIAKLRRQLEEAKELARESEQQRNSVQEELFRRLYEQRELDRQKTQFQAQLAEYEKFAALAQLALGAAHEINNPLLGILSHLELELKTWHEPGDQAEILQCIAGAKRISSTLRGLADYVRQYVRQVCQGREDLQQEFTRSGIPFWPSHANFVLAQFGPLNNAFIERMRSRGILVRDRSRDHGCEGCVRITLGTTEQTARLLTALRETQAEIDPKQIDAGRIHARTTDVRTIGARKVAAK